MGTVTTAARELPLETHETLLVEDETLTELRLAEGSCQKTKV